MTSGSPSEMVVTWSTLNDTAITVVEYGTSTPSLTAKGSATKFVDGGALHATQFIHRVRLQNLLPGQQYGKLFNPGRARLSQQLSFGYPGHKSQSMLMPRAHRGKLLTWNILPLYNIIF